MMTSTFRRRHYGPRTSETSIMYRLFQYGDSGNDQDRQSTLVVTRGAEPGAGIRSDVAASRLPPAHSIVVLAESPERRARATAIATSGQRQKFVHAFLSAGI
jgi:hypothetical protein